MTVTSDRTSSAAPELDQDSQLPKLLSLGHVLDAIRLTPGEIQHLLRDLAQNYLGGNHHELGLALRDHGDMVADPRTYGYKVPEAGPAPAAREYTPPTPGEAAYARDFSKPSVEAPVAREAMFTRPGEVPTPQAPPTGENPSA